MKITSLTVTSVVLLIMAVVAYFGHRADKDTAYFAMYMSFLMLGIVTNVIDARLKKIEKKLNENKRDDK